MAKSQALSGAEEAHEAFQVHADLSKAIRLVAIGIETLSAVIVVPAVAGVQLSQQAGVAAVFMAVAGVVLRQYAGSHDAASARFRSESINAYCFDAPVDPMALADVRAHSPPSWIRRVLFPFATPKSLDAYYEATMPLGAQRLREITAHSALYTSDIMRLFAFLSLAAALLLGAATWLYLDWVIRATPDARLHIPDVGALYSVVLGVFAVRALETCFRAFGAARDATEVRDTLLRPGQLSEDAIAALAARYGWQRCSAPPAPYLLYLARRSRLASAWQAARGALPPPAGTTTTQ